FQSVPVRQVFLVMEAVGNDVTIPFHREFLPRLFQLPQQVGYRCAGFGFASFAVDHYLHGRSLGSAWEVRGFSFCPPGHTQKLKCKRPSIMHGKRGVSSNVFHGRRSGVSDSQNPAGPSVGIIMGSRSDWDTMSGAADILEKLEVAFE